jgi:uncharacterized protein (DUF1501 family)
MLQPQTSDYKALVCIFLFGGNDAGNMVIPYDDYASYAAVRQPAGIAIRKPACFRFGPPVWAACSASHPSLTGLQELWSMGRLGVICNTGPLVEPTTHVAVTPPELRMFP